MTISDPNFSPQTAANPRRGPLGIPFGWWAIIGLIYIVSPLDALPDFLPVIGWADDTGMLGFAIYSLFKWYRARRSIV
jgi:uncharacterized membrane protein YkvA (DUF1232 family)